MTVLDGINIAWLLAGGIASLLSYLAFKLNSQHQFYKDKPCPPHSFFWGHLKVMGEMVPFFPRRSYIQSILTHIKHTYDLPDIWYLDLWPVGPKFLVITDPDAAAALTTVTPYPQSSIVGNHFKPNFGTTFIEATNGTLWKELHQLIAPGLNPATVRSYHEIIVDEAVTLHDRFQAISDSHKPCPHLNFEFGKYPFEVVSRVFLGQRLGSQDTDSSFYDELQHLGESMSAFAGEQNFVQVTLAKQSMRKHSRNLRDRIARYIRDRFAELREKKIVPTRNNAESVIDRMLAPHIESGRPLGEDVLKVIVDNCFGFMAAGFGTTSDTTTYMYMMLGAFPEVLAKLREEHDRIFDKSYEKTLEMVRENPSLLAEMKYTTSFIYETLRVFPIAMVVRDTPPDTNFIELKGVKYPLNGHVLAINSHTMHLDSTIFPEPKKFDPDRFLDYNSPSFPRNAYRPFERGLRSCMGRTLAMEEMKMVLLMTARWFDFELMDHKPAKKPRLPQSDMDTIIGVHAYQTFNITAGPPEPVKMSITSRH